MRCLVTMHLPTLFYFLLSLYGVSLPPVVGVPLEPPNLEDVVPLHLALRGRLHRDAGALAQPAVRRRDQGLRLRHASLLDAAPTAALESRGSDADAADCDDDEGSSDVARPGSKERREAAGTDAPPLAALAPRREGALSHAAAETEENNQTPALDVREAAANAQSAPATTTAVAPLATGTNTPLPTSYAPGWCGLHIHQVLWNTCLNFNHKE